MQCELCGRPVRGHLTKVWIEGAELSVCSNCSRYGYIARSERAMKVQPPIKRKSATKIGMEDLVPRDDYNLLIRQTRERMGMTQMELARLIGEKESVIRRLESGRMKPSMELARKLEKALKIKLFEEVKQQEDVPESRGVQLTLGDVVVVKERSKQLST
ncbi:MAG: multiprotein bridging factor aMBF1 [Candidatus Nezhaarchaeota archaeon]|nr:multiprotein bridging factor aMBF1 [Candidatus Nezhaarchaeota archaeon]MCX8141998.1 multiprotein bridging factor aMBF1 [Candidatus Nezhaarchaeota archaeon]MDW8050221.1 multiprotein bridging factor aMBF1 [Nitrososphaerota archaeon]